MLKFFQSWRDIYLKIELWPVYRITEVFILEVKPFQKYCHVQPGIDILFVKLPAEIGD